MNELISEETKYFVACNPLLDVYHNGEVSNGRTRSGQPMMVFKADKQEVIDLIYSSFDEDLDSDTVYTTHEVNWSVYSTESEAQEVINKLNNYDFIKVNLIKHPLNAEWAVPSSDVIFNSLPEGEDKTWLYNKSVESISLGRRHDKQYMLENGWV